MSRLFPFKRGLTHAYWAPNIWALYNFADRVLIIVCRRFNLPFVRDPPAADQVEEIMLTETKNKEKIGSSANQQDGSGNSQGSANQQAVSGGTNVSSSSGKVASGPTSGLVQEVFHLVLPPIAPWVTIVLTLLSSIPVLIQVWRTPQPRVFVSAISYVAMCSFMLGWHVHEKAVLLVIIPLALSSIDSTWQTKTFLISSVFASFSLVPLLPAWETISFIGLLLCDIHARLTVLLLHDETRLTSNARRIRYTDMRELLTRFELFLLFGVAFEALGYYGVRIFLPNMEFLPLMIVSVYSAIGLIHVW